MNSVKLVLSAAIVLLILSCKKKSEEPTPTENLTVVDYEMLHITKPEWLIYKVDVSGNDVWKIPNFIQTCMKDDTYRFHKDSTLTTYENANKCSGNPDSTLSSWQFTDGRKRLVSNFLGSTDTANILLLTDTTMNLFLNYQGTDATVFFKKK